MTNVVNRPPHQRAAGALLFVWIVFGSAAQAGAAPPVAVTSDGPPSTLTIGGDAWFRQRMLSWEGPDLPEKKSQSMVTPVERLRLTSRFGTRIDPLRGTPAIHLGVDIASPSGTPVYATADGHISQARYGQGYGNLVAINHGNGLESRYAHLSRILVKPNEAVKSGQLIALTGSTGRSTGSHLHYEVRANGRPVDPVTPLNQIVREDQSERAGDHKPRISAFAQAQLTSGKETAE